MIATEGDHQPGRAAVVVYSLDTCDAFRAEGLPVVGHCHGGASRSGLVLRAWLMRTNDWDEPRATDHLQGLWPALGLWNESFTEFLRTEWAR